MLPTIVAPLHEVKLFSLKKPVQMRPYLVAEEKIFLTAQQSGNPKEIEGAVKQIIKNVTNGAVNVDRLPSFDLEFLFLQMRARSVNDIIDIRFKCNNETANGTCPGAMAVKINIDDIKLDVPEGHTNKFMITSDVGVTFKYLTYDMMQAFIDADLSDNLQLSVLLKSTLDTVFTAAGEVHDVTEQPPAEVDAFVNSLTLAQVEHLKTFFETMPRIRHKFTFTCPSCAYTEDVVLEGLLDFFE